MPSIEWTGATIDYEYFEDRYAGGEYNDRTRIEAAYMVAASFSMAINGIYISEAETGGVSAVAGIAMGATGLLLALTNNVSHRFATFLVASATLAMAFWSANAGTSTAPGRTPIQGSSTVLDRASSRAQMGLHWAF